MGTWICARKLVLSLRREESLMDKVTVYKGRIVGRMDERIWPDTPYTVKLRKQLIELNQELSRLEESHQTQRSKGWHKYMDTGGLYGDGDTRAMDKGNAYYLPKIDAIEDKQSEIKAELARFGWL